MKYNEMKETNWTYSGTQIREPSERELLHSRLARTAAAEGMVLLKNEGLLPFDRSETIALLGSGAVRTVKGGTGSGDVNNRNSISIYQGMEEAGISMTGREWLQDYQKRYDDARQAWKEKVLADTKKVDNPFDAYSANPFSRPEGRRITDEDIRGASAAVYVVSRISGEGKDRRREEGDYYLSRKEREDILFLNDKNIPVALVLNTGGPVELTDILEEAGNIKAVLNISLPGQEGGYAVADILTGKIAPSGRLTATWARRYEDYPSAESFGYLNGNLDMDEYREGIYVGYRYFDYCGRKPLFPFGYGLSYTEFSMKCEGVRCAGTGVEADVTVKNTGKRFFGREVVQVYLTLPQTGMDKEFRRLAGFAKTDVLQPGEGQTVTITIEPKQFASFSEQESAWVIEEGKYGLWFGEHIESLQPAALLTVEKKIVLEQAAGICPNLPEFEAPVRSEHLKKKAVEWLALAGGQNVPDLQFEPEKERKKAAEYPEAEQQPVELLPLLYGNIAKNTSTLGAAGIRVPGSAGETTQVLEEKYGIRSLVMADGPAGLRLQQSYEVNRKTGEIYGAGVLGSLENGFLEDKKRHEDADVYYQFCTAFPVGTALAQTWDTSLVYQFGEAVAEEMEEFHIDLWLAPGMNIHRNPLCGRNFEYFSEDPFLSGILAAVVTDGVQKNGNSGVTIKHFACNNQEDNRMGVDVHVSERALREIYMRGFEIAVKKSAPAAIMSSYNCINGMHAANSRYLCTTVAREEWGFEGVIMSDWFTTGPEDGSIPWKCITAGNDLIMPGDSKDEEDLVKAFVEGKLLKEDVQISAGRILALIQKLTG